MKQSVKVSIIVPFYNVETYLLACLNSIKKQTYKNIEVILINDGSTDNSDILAEHFAYEDKRFTVYHTNNHGPAHARNLGIKKATGSWLQFVDADDTIAANMTASLVKNISEQVDLVICGYKGDKVYQAKSSGTYLQEEFLQEFGSFFLGGLISSPCNKLYRLRSLEVDHILFPENYQLGEDLLFQLKVLAITRKIAVIQDTPYFYKERQASLTKRYIPNYIAIQKVLYEKTKQFLKETNSKTTQNKADIDRVFAQHFRHAASNLFHPDNPMTSKEKQKQIKQFLQTKEIQDFTAFYKGGMDEVLFRYLIHTRMTFLASLYFSLKETLRKYAPSLLEFFRQGEKQ